MSDILPTEIPGPVDSDVEKISKAAESIFAQNSPPEIEPFNISFVDYKEDKCKIDGMEGKNAQMALKIVRDIGLNFKSGEHFQSKMASSKLEIKHVSNSSPYDDYYKRLPTEVVDSEEVKEIKYLDTRPEKEVNLRIYYYTLANIFYMLAITADFHENLDHKPVEFKRNKKRKW